MIQEVSPEEQHSDNGLDDQLADAHAAGIFYAAALAAVSFEESEELEDFQTRISRMKLDSDNSDDDQGGASDAESYGKVASDDEPEPAPFGHNGFLFLV